MKWIKSQPWETEAREEAQSFCVYHSGGLTLDSWFDVVLKAKILEPYLLGSDSCSHLSAKCSLGQVA